jgi:hypothetical protein
MSELVLAAGLLVSVLLCAAALLKLRRLGEFRRELADYGFMPRRLEAVVTPAVPICELAAASAFWNAESRTFGAGAMAVLLLSFASVLAYSLARGRRDLRCACFGRSRRSITWALPARNLALAAVAIANVAHDTSRVPFPSTGAWMAVALVALIGWEVYEYAGMTSSLQEG